MSKYELTQREYLAVMGTNPSSFTTRDYNGNPISPDLNRPVNGVNWNDATNYCGKLTALERAASRLPAGWEYRLPTEAEWEYACRAGSTTAFHAGNELRSGMANFDGRSEYVGGTGRVNNPKGIMLWRTTTVGSYQPNAFGLYDMHGNVGEWCMDWYGSYSSGSVSDPVGPSLGSGRVIRGGGWDGGARPSRPQHSRTGSGVGIPPTALPSQPLRPRWARACSHARFPCSDHPLRVRCLHKVSP